MKSKDETLKAFDDVYVEREKILDKQQNFIDTLDFNVKNGTSWSECFMPIKSVTKEEFKAMHTVKWIKQ